MTTPTLPPDEVVLWEGSPAWRSVARRLFRIRWIGFYFALLLALSVGSAAAASVPIAVAMPTWTKLLLGCAFATGLAALLAWRIERTTVYTITERRIVMRYGMALQATLMLPFVAIESVGVRINPDHTGDIALRLKPGSRVSYPKLWPHARGWRWRHPEPMLRNLPDAARIGPLLSRALAAARQSTAG